MTYNISITKNDIPQDDHQAWNILNELQNKELSRTTESQEFLRLVKKLKSVFGCISDSSDEEKQPPWADGPILTNAGQHVTILSLTYDGVDKLPEIVKVVNEEGFVLFDEQEGEIYRDENDQKI